MFFAGAVGFGAANLKMMREIAPEPAKKVTKTTVALDTQFDQEKAQILSEFDTAENRQVSQYMAILDRIRNNRQRPDKNEADREVAARIEVVKSQSAENMETVLRRMGQLKEHYEEVYKVLEQECVDDFLQSARWHDRKKNDEGLNEAKAGIRTCLDEMHSEIDRFILEEKGKSLNEVCGFTLEKYEEFEGKVDKVKRQAALDLKGKQKNKNKKTKQNSKEKKTKNDQEYEPETKARNKRLKNAWWKWILILAEMLLIS